MQRDSFIFYRSFFEASKPLPAEDRIKLLDAIFEYGLNENQIELPALAEAMFCLIKPQLSANHKRFKNGKKGKDYGKLGGRPKKKSRGYLGVSDSNPKLTPNNNVNLNLNPNVNENVNKEVASLPLWLPVNDWKDFLEMRKKKDKGAKLTDRQVSLLITSLDGLRQKGHDPSVIIQQSIERGWKGFFEPKQDYTNSNETDMSWMNKPEWN